MVFIDGMLFIGMSKPNKEFRVLTWQEIRFDSGN